VNNVIDIKAEETKLGIGGSIYSAQIIIDAFSRALSENNCMTRIPISVYAQADENENRLYDVIDSLGGDSSSLPGKEYEYVLQTTEIQTEKGLQPVTNTTASIRRSMEDACLDCGIDIPDFDLGSVFDGIMSDINGFINNMTNAFNNSVPNHCHFAYLLSFVCIPDLIKILALILGYIIKLTASLFIGTFSIGAFIMAIVGKILSAIMKYALAIMGIALSPVSCLIESITAILDTIPGKDNLRDKLGSEEYGLLYGEDASQEDIDSFSDIAKKYNESIGEAYKNSTEDVKNNFKKIKGSIEEADEGVQESIQNLIALKDFLECEPKRSGVNIFGQIGAVAELMSIVNLIRAVITKKSENTAYDELCRLQDREVETGFNPDEIADVIEDAFDGVATIIENQAGDGDIAILFEQNEDPGPDNLGFFSCNLNDIIESSHMDNIIDDAIFSASVRFKNEGSSPKFSKRTRTRLNDPNLTLVDNQQVMLFGEPNSDTVQSSIIEAIDTVVSYNPIKGERRKISDNTLIRERLKDFKLDKDTLPSDVSETSSDVSETSSGDTVEELREEQDIDDTFIGGISGNILSKPLQLKCGTIENLQERFSFIEES
jgi:hypothetical protein